MSRRTTTNRARGLTRTASTVLSPTASETDAELIALLDEAKGLMEADRLAPLDGEALTARIFGRVPSPWADALDAAARIPAKTSDGVKRKAEATADEDWDF